MEKFNAYIDGFSLYKGALERRPSNKWLDLISLCQSRVPQFQLGKIYYFTARVKGRFPDDGAHNRQHKYFRVLRDQGVEIVEGKFRKDSDWLRLVEAKKESMSDPQLPSYFGLTQIGIKGIFQKSMPDFPKSLVWKYGEKGSDVNLASYLLKDVFKNGVNNALVVSGDSDLVTPIRFARAEGVYVQILHPHKGSGSAELKEVSSKFEELHPSWLSGNQFPRSYITRKGGNIVRPIEWQ